MISCETNDLANQARCFSCLPPDILMGIQTYLLCQVLNSGIVGKGYVLSIVGGWEAGPAPISTTIFKGGDAYNSLYGGDDVYNNQRIMVPKAGTAKFVYVKLRVQTPGSNDNIAHSIRLNNTSDFGAINLDATAMVQDGFALTNQAVSQGDYIALKIVIPSFALEPDGLRWYCSVYIE